MSAAGFHGVEPFAADLNEYANAHSLFRTQAASQVKNPCSQNNLEIVCVGSFDNFEGNASRSLAERLESAKE